MYIDPNFYKMPTNVTFSNRHDAKGALYILLRMWKNELAAFAEILLWENPHDEIRFRMVRYGSAAEVLQPEA